MFAYHIGRPIMVFHLHSWGITFASYILLETRRDEKGMKQIQMLGHFIHAQSYIARHIASDICVHIQNRDAG